MRVEGYQYKRCIYSNICTKSSTRTRSRPPARQSVFSNITADQSERRFEIKLIFCSQTNRYYSNRRKTSQGPRSIQLECWMIADLGRSIYQLEINGNYIYHEEGKNVEWILNKNLLHEVKRGDQM